MGLSLYMTSQRKYIGLAIAPVIFLCWYFVNHMQESFEPGIKDWLEEVKLYASNDICKLLVGNKCDLSEKREVDFLDAKVRVNSLYYHSNFAIFGKFRNSILLPLFLLFIYRILQTR